MKPYAQVTKAVNALGATIDRRSLASGRLVIDAPQGQVWSANGSHALVAECNDAGYADVLERMAYGLDVCTDLNCEMCEENQQ